MVKSAAIVIDMVLIQKVMTPFYVSLEKYFTGISPVGKIAVKCLS